MNKLAAVNTVVGWQAYSGFYQIIRHSGRRPTRYLRGERLKIIFSVPVYSLQVFYFTLGNIPEHPHVF